jgi:hypothetical protein
MALRCAAGDKSGKIFDGVLAVDPNLEKGTCYLTGMFSRLDPDNSGDLMNVLRQVGGECESADEWTLVHDHIANCMDKLSSDITVLVQQCQDIAGPFADVKPEDISPFVNWFRQAGQHAGKVLCVFSDSPLKRTLIAEMRLQNLETGSLGRGFNNDSFVFVPESRHLDLMRPEVLRQHQESFVNAI